MTVQVYQIAHGACPYLPNRPWITQTFQIPSLEDKIYEHMINSGWRRSGPMFYQNHCPGCSLCIPIRIPVTRFAPSKSQRRVWKKNSDVAVVRQPTHFTEESFELYQKYQAARHDPDDNVTHAGYLGFLGRSPVTTQMMSYYADGRLIGIGWVDILPSSVSSVYFVFDPDYSRRSLGTFSVLKEIELCQELGKPFHHLGFYVPGSRKMTYKANFRPHQLLIRGEWRDHYESGEPSNE